jgi:hypothetical protein
MSGTDQSDLAADGVDAEPADVPEPAGVWRRAYALVLAVLVVDVVLLWLLGFVYG